MRCGADPPVAPKMAMNWSKLVIRSGTPAGPRPVGPIRAAVDVPTPWITPGPVISWM